MEILRGKESCLIDSYTKYAISRNSECNRKTISFSRIRTHINCIVVPTPPSIPCEFFGGVGISFFVMQNWLKMTTTNWKRKQLY